MYLAEMVIVSAAGTALIWLPNIYVYIVIRSIGGFGRAILYSTLFIWGKYEISYHSFLGLIDHITLKVYLFSM